MSESALQSGRVVAIGELASLEGYALAGVDVRVAESDADALRQWSALETDVAVVFLTPESAAALGDTATALSGPLTVVVPQ